jgi:hypothetical protein
MLLFGHIGITLGVLLGVSYFAPRLKDVIDPRYLVIGALLPDLIDKPLGMIIFASIFSNGRIMAHTLLFSLTVLLIGLYLYNKRGDIRITALASGSFFHLIEDQMWISPQTLLWPLFGWHFQKGQIANGLEFLVMLSKESFTPEFSQRFIPTHTFIPEIIGMMVIVILALNWLKERLYKINYKHKEDSETKKRYEF